MKIAITGATGQFGSLVIESLLKTVPAGDLVVSVRNPDKASDLKTRGVEVRHGDFDQPETLATAFAGVDRLLIVSADGDNETRIRQHKAAVNAAVKAGVGFIAYTSVGDAEKSELFLAEVHRVTEETIRATGIPFSFLRNNWYMENEVGSIQGAVAGAPWVTSAGSGKVGWAARGDYAEAAANVLTGEGHENTVYELSGKPLTQDELTKIIGDVIGKEIKVMQVDDEAYAKIMAEVGVPEAALPIVVAIQRGIREGWLDIVSDDLEKVLSRPVTPLADVIRDLVNSLQA
ncbi:NAD(P)H dehydrogenase (quinone) [Paenibacillus sp. PastF-3]|jgi:NAD(P)H dehydrogenase (quinone)|uniref:SDR family oxidoreductase n=1 Tax=Paenibacillus TaxID=44249 RepID=UPI002473ED79|nr:SDR family oxidoreductase [Paenibacillus sp. PastF-3]MDH6368694.1 NAD(P)H dehydrogenase (quinone) [Paenibacillus sp. PastF-3]